MPWTSTDGAGGAEFYRRAVDASRARGMLCGPVPRPLARSAVFLALSAAALCARPGVAPAQSSHIEAQVRAQQAREALRRNDTTEALRLYRAAVELDPAPRTLREFAELLEQKGALREASAVWTRYAALEPDAHARDGAIVRRESLRRTSSLLRVRVSPPDAARLARVWFDHDPPRAIPVGGAESLVDGGSHRVRVESPGYAPFEAMVSVAYGEPREVVTRLVPVGPGGDTLGAHLPNAPRTIK